VKGRKEGRKEGKNTTFSLRSIAAISASTCIPKEGRKVKGRKEGRKEGRKVV
jgi:hypothetical protein